MNKSQGFTLIELMIVVAILGIIAGIAYPSYVDHMQKARRSDAQAALMGLAMAQAKYRIQCPQYASSLASSNDCTNGTLKAPQSSENSYYQLSVSSASGNAYTLTASAQGVQANDSVCTAITFTVNASNPNGVKAPEQCWQ
ncbi:type IV pilin protein [Thalassotalea maritima]|uniref:type IV pilin protein n=1 Tax=Thalassotalea maritima TaxID=3242416 RepID=UPI0035270F7E